MSRKRQLFKVIQKTFGQISKQFLSAINKQIIWLLRAISGTRRRRGSENAGFLLPTVAMVSLVVVLLTTAILFRSFERSKNASNVRVNQAVLNAATPAIDRARAKLDKLFDDRRLPRATPSDIVLESTFKNNLNEYTFGDETQLNLNYTDPNATPTVQAALPTAWMFPVDTNNNGKFDTYTLYGIYFRTPPITGGTYSRVRNPLEARTPPMTSGSVSTGCQDTLGTSASLVGNTGWINIASKLKKSFFVYTANVPITNPPATGSDAGKYETFQGNKGFSGLEYQQDRIQLPLVNNAVVYDDDIELTPGPAFNLNGRILTNSNFLTGSNFQTVTLYQVSSENSCFYDDDNAKIVVGGNLSGGAFTADGDYSNTTGVHLFQGQGVDPNLTLGVTANKSISPETPKNIAYNSLAYVQRINLLVQAQMANAASSDPQEAQDGIAQQLKVLNLTTSTASTAQQTTIRNNQLQLYFKKRTRRVPYGEVAFGVDATTIGTDNNGAAITTTNVLQESGNSLRPQDSWVYPFKPSDGQTKTNYANLTLNTASSTKLLPSATETTTQQKLGKEQYVGDRILLGNNLPALWWNTATSTFIGSDSTDTQDITGINWDNGTGTRNRRSRVQQLADLGTVDRDGDWESAAATLPSTPQDSVGGLRVVTGAGIYLPQGYTVGSTQALLNTALNPAAGGTNRIWSDMMPVPNGIAINADKSIQDTKNSNIYLPIITPTPPTNPLTPPPVPPYTPYLRMRATAVYHYQANNYNATTPKPIACISSFYDPTNSTTAKNLASLPYNNITGGNSHNGIVYAAPTKAVSDYSALLNYQANLMYPNGRLVNEVLKTALPKTASSRTLSEQSAIHAAICAIQILDGTIGSPDSTVIPHGAIYETAFLDARQVKAIHKDVQIDASGNIIPGRETFTNADGDGTGTVAQVPDASAGSTAPDYELAKETRQPLEIRATVLDINLLRTTTYGTGTGSGTTATQEYLIPNSGIIYATRDDALLDLSASSSSGIDTQKTKSPVDFKLDPTRRPNAIMLINGNPIWRVLGFRDAEKGFILASNLPVYIKGDFNKHTQEEFNTALASDLGNFYSRSDRNTQFACRKNDTRLPGKCLPDGDAWRPASVLSDAITLLSNNFKLGNRSDGDYDLNNNLGDTNSITAFQNNGFATNNTNVVNALWYDPTNTSNNVYPVATINSSYFNNFVTPIQRRRTAPEYLMEVCPKLPVSACDPGTDWWVRIPADGGLKASDVIASTFDIATHKAGTTAVLPDASYLSYPRRVAFQRATTSNTVPILPPATPPLYYTHGELKLAGYLPAIIGLTSSGGTKTIKSFPLNVGSFSGTDRPTSQSNALWFLTTQLDTEVPNNDDYRPKLLSAPAFTDDTATFTAGTKTQPALSPMLQIKVAFGTNRNESPTSNAGKLGPGGDNQDTNWGWLQQASTTGTTFNLVAAGGDTPARPTEDNGGLHNFVRFLENWNPTTSSTANAFAAKINGSFIQRTRSVYATAPYVAYLNGSSLKGYPIGNASGQVPFYLSPLRQWGYDVALLSQSPDAFSQKLAITPDDKPNEYFREVGRDDAWVQTLLCAKDTKGTVSISDDTAINAIDQAQCP
ncbi:hormogonium polysaccharide biosynthesis protein HpsA [Nostoc sp.]|uniref:hormogonium polysaccharide biosynthesis protein HpsA n=1 Tax=Nostoc sp. TaxID=1180 RepID=UPI002FF4F1D1